RRAAGRHGRRPARHHGGAGREPVVHERLQQPDRAHHHRRGDHDVRRSRRQRRPPVRDHGRARREHLVHHLPERLHRPHLDGRLGITTGPETNMWFTSTINDRIGRIATTGPPPGPPPAPPEPVVVAPRFTG